MPSSRKPTLHPSAKTSKTYSSLRLNLCIVDRKIAPRGALPATSFVEDGLEQADIQLEALVPEGELLRQGAAQDAHLSREVPVAFTEVPWLFTGNGLLAEEREEAAQAGTSPAAPPPRRVPPPPAPDMREGHGFIVPEERNRWPSRRSGFGGGARGAGSVHSPRQNEPNADTQNGALGHEDLLRVQIRRNGGEINAGLQTARATFGSAEPRCTAFSEYRHFSRHHSKRCRSSNRRKGCGRDTACECRQCVMTGNPS